MKHRTSKTEATTGGVRPAETPGGGLAEQVRPWLLAAATALWVARPLYPSEAAAAHGDGLPVVMLWLALAVCWLFSVAGGRRFVLRFGGTDAAAGLLIALYAAAALWAARHESPRPALNMLWEWTGMGLGFFLTRQLLRGAVEARAMITVMIALAAGLSGYGLYQRSVEMPRDEEEYKLDPDATAHAAGVWAPAGSPQRQHLEDRLKNREPMATFALTNSLAAMLAPWLVLAIGIAASCSTRRKAVRCILPALLIAACLALTKSRSSYVAVAVGLALWGLAKVFRTRRVRKDGAQVSRTRRVPAAILGAALAAAVLLAALWAAGLPPSLLAAKAAKSFGYRLQYWQATLRMIAEHPLAGCGPGNFQDAYTAYKLPEASEEVADPHNFLLEVWATAGTPAMLALVALLASFAWRMGTVPISAATTPCVVPGHKNGTVPFAPVDQGAGDRSGPLFAGLVAGFLLAVPLGQIGAAPPALAATLLGLPLAGVCLLLWAPWVRDQAPPGARRLTPAVAGVGVAVMLVNLSAAGGIGQPGVAGSFWLLLALALDGQGERTLPRPAAWSMLAAALALTAACYVTGYRPVLRSEAALRSAEVALFNDRGSDALQDLDEAARAEPLAAEPWRQLAGLTFQQWQRQPSEENFRRFDLCMKTALERAPRAAATWLAAGERYTAVFAHSRQAADRDAALDAYRRAVQLYPNNALYHAEFALALRAVGQRDAFRREADAALDLDKLNPHAEKRLPPEVRKRLEK